MKRGILFLLLIPLLYGITACKKDKTVIPVPVACMTLSATTLHLHDTLVVHNCSVADQTWVCFTDSTKPSLKTCQCSPVSYTIGRTQTFRYVFSQTGHQYVHIQAMNYVTGSPLEYEDMLVNVIP